MRILIFLKIKYALFLPFSKDMKNLGYRTTTYEVYYECILPKYPKAGNIQSVFLAKKGKKNEKYNRANGVEKRT